VEASTVQAPKTASVYICRNGHRTVSFWSVPETCSRRRVHSQPECGLPLVPLADAPADAKEKMLNPLKASKKAAKKK
jgi:hypothetical protein